MFIDKVCSLLVNDDDECDDERDGQRLDFVFSIDEEFSGDANGVRSEQLLKEMEVSSSEDEMSIALEKRERERHINFWSIILQLPCVIFINKYYFCLAYTPPKWN